MATPAVNLPPLPPGFKLDAPQADIPPLPPGFTLDQATPGADPFAGDDLLSNESMAQLAAGERSTVTPTQQPSMVDRASKYAGEYLGGIKSAAQAAVPTSGMPIMDAGRAMLGIGEAGATIASGAIAMPLASARGIVTGKAPTNENISRLTYEPRSAAGKAALGMSGAVAKPITDAAEATGADIALLPLAAESQALRTVERAPKAPKLVPDAVPSREDLATSARDAYQRAKDAGAVAAPQSYSRMASGLRSSLREQGFNPKLHPKAAAVVEEIEKTSNGAPVALDELEILRRQALAAERSIEADERRVASLIIDRIDDYADALASGAEPVMGGNAPAAVAARKEARDLYSRSRKSMEIGELMERAQIRASQFSGSGEENALRTEFRQLAMNPKRLRRFNQEEQRAIKEVAFGTPTRNALTQIGKLAPTGGLSQWLGIGATMINPLAAAVPAAGAAARMGATRLTRNAAQRAEELMRRGPRREPAPAVAAVADVDTFDAERASAAEAARGSYDVEELPGEVITLETPPNRVRQLEPQLRNAARTAVATKTAAPSVKQIETQMQSLQQRAAGLPSDAPELLEIEAQFSTLQEELALAKSRQRPRNRVEQLSRGQ